MKQITQLLICASLALGAASCKKFDSLQDNPNKPTVSPRRCC